MDIEGRLIAWLEKVVDLVNDLAHYRVAHTKTNCRCRTRCTTWKIPVSKHVTSLRNQGGTKSFLRVGPNFGYGPSWQWSPAGVSVQCFPACAYYTSIYYVRFNKRQELFESPFIHPQIF